MLVIIINWVLKFPSFSVVICISVCTHIIRMILINYVINTTSLFLSLCVCVASIISLFSLFLYVFVPRTYELVTQIPIEAWGEGTRVFELITVRSERTS